MTSEFIEGIIEKFGEAALVGEDDTVEVISTGCLSLDVSIGVGGIPRGKITEIFGPEGSAKTTIALSVVKTVLADGGKACYIDVEHMLDYPLLKDMLGEVFDPKRFIILTPDTAEDAFEMAEAAFASEEFDLVVIDSVGALAPSTEKKDEFGKAGVGAIPRMINKFLRRNLDSIKKKQIALLIINQIRDKIGAYMPTFDTPGGHALKHFASLRIALSKGQELKVGNEKVGIMVKFVIKKNKLSAPFRSYTIPIVFGKGVDSFSDAVDFCSMLGVIKKKGSYYKFEDVILGQGKLSAGEYLSQHLDTLEEIKTSVYNVLNKYTSIDVEAVEKEMLEAELEAEELPLDSED